MPQYHNPTGFIGTASVIRNSNANFPTVAAAENTLSGLGFFSHVGIDSSGSVIADNNTSSSSYAYYLVNLPFALRSQSYIAVLDVVTADTTTSDAGWTTAAVPSIYVYTSSDLGDVAWKTGSNWQLIGGNAGGGTIDFHANGSVINGTADSLDFIGTANQITVSAANNGSDADEVQVTLSLPDEVSIVTKLNVGNFINATDQIITAPQIVAGTSVKIGGSTNTAELAVSGSAYINDHLDFGGTSATIGNLKTIDFNSTQGLINAPGGLITTIDNGQVWGLRNSEGNKYLVAEAGANNTSKLRLGGVGMDADAGGGIFINNNSIAADTSVTAAVFRSSTGQLFTRELSSYAFGGVQTFADFNMTSPDGSIIVNQTNATVEVNPSKYLTTDTDQQTTVAKTFGSIKLNGIEATVSGDIVGEDGAHPLYLNNLETSPTSINTGLTAQLLVVGADAVVRKAGTQFVASITAGDDITVTSPATDYITTIAVKDRFLRNDSEDQNIFTSAVSRFQIKKFYPATYTAIGTASGASSIPTASPNAYLEWGYEHVGNVVGNVNNAANTMYQAGIIGENAMGKSWRLGGHEAGQSFNSADGEELSGHVTTSGIPSANYATYQAPYAMMVGSGTAYVSNENQNRLNVVTIPNLITKYLHSSDGNYLAGGGTLSGDWNVLGTLSINGTPITTDNTGTISITATGTLLGLGVPDPATSTAGNTTDTSDIGMYGYYLHTDSDNDYIVDTNEASTLTGFYRDADASAFGGFKPWAIVDGITSSTDGGNVVPSAGLAYSPLMLGGLKFIANTSAPSGSTYSTYFIEGVVHEIASNVTINHTQHIPTTWAVKQYVDAEVASITGFTTADEADFVWGLGGANGTSETGTWVEANEHRLYGENAAGTGHASFTARELGLAIDFNTSQTNRPTIGYLPGATAFTQGDTLKSIIKQIFVAYEQPQLFFDATRELGTEMAANSLFPESGKSKVIENGDTFVHTGEVHSYITNEANVTHDTGEVGASLSTSISTNLPRTKITTLISNVNFTPQGGSSTTSIPEINYTNTDGYEGTHTIHDTLYKYVGDGALDVNGQGWNQLGNNSVIAINNNYHSGYLRFTWAFDAGLVNSDYEDVSLGYNNSDFTQIQVYRRSFYFASDFDARAYLLDASHSLDDTIFSPYVNYAGNQANSGAGGGSRKLMHSLITRMENATSTVTTTQALSSISGDSGQTTTGVPVMGTGGQTSLSTTIKALSCAGSEAFNSSYITSTTTQSTSAITFDETANGYSGGATITGTSVSSSLVGNGLLQHKGVLMSNSTNGGVGGIYTVLPAQNADEVYTYVAFPVEFGGPGNSTSNSSGAAGWLVSTANGTSSRWVFNDGVGNSDLLLRTASGDVATFTYTDRFAVDRTYVLMQSVQPAVSSSSLPKLIQI